MFFSHRKGYKSVSKIIQLDGMSEELRTSLWNVLDLFIWQKENFLYSNTYGKIPEMEFFSKILWFNYFKIPIDSRPTQYDKQLFTIRGYFFSCKWHEVYDFVEFTLRVREDQILTDAINSILEQELSAYRFVGGIITDITSEQEILMIEEAIDDKDFPGVASHLRRALELLSDRKNPDYRNSIKESISAVESISRIITNEPKATLGQALNIIERNGKIHPALKEAFAKLYGFTSDQDGIRHAMLEEPILTGGDAKFFLMSCTSFINYLKSKL